MGLLGSSLQCYRAKLLFSASRIARQGSSLIPINCQLLMVVSLLVVFINVFNQMSINTPNNVLRKFQQLQLFDSNRQAILFNNFVNQFLPCQSHIYKLYDVTRRKIHPYLLIQQKEKLPEHPVSIDFNLQQNGLLFLQIFELASFERKINRCMENYFYVECLNLFNIIEKLQNCVTNRLKINLLSSVVKYHTLVDEAKNLNNILNEVYSEPLVFSLSNFVGTREKLIYQMLTLYTTNKSKILKEVKITLTELADQNYVPDATRRDALMTNLHFLINQLENLYQNLQRCRDYILDLLALASKCYHLQAQEIRKRTGWIYGEVSDLNTIESGDETKLENVLYSIYLDNLLYCNGTLSLRVDVSQSLPSTMANSRMDMI